MSTAIAYCGRPEGFVIGAEGRVFNKLTQRIESNTTQKIFAFESPAASIVFAWAGVIKTVSADGSSYFSLVDDTHELLPQLDFTNFFAQELNAKLQARLRGLRVNRIGDAAYGVFLSFRNSRPWISLITAFMNGRTWDCKVEENEANGEIGILTGPDADFEVPRTLKQAENAIGLYLEDCVANPTDEIGGHIHIARFTADGFIWIRPPASSK